MSAKHGQLKDEDSPELCPDDSVVIGGTLVITLEKKSGLQGTVPITAPGDLPS